MVEKLMEQQVIFYAMGIAAGIEVLSKLISHITLRRMAKAAGNMSKSNHKLMKLVKAKFEHASMISDKVQNVKVFVKKYIYEYRVFGIRLHTWRQMEKKAIGLTGILGALGAAAAYEIYGTGQAVRYGVWGTAGVIILYFIHHFTDESYRLDMAENYMVDFLENVCAHRYAKTYPQRELSQEEILQMEEAFAEPSGEDAPVMEADSQVEKELEKRSDSFEEKVTQEVQIRKILEEFLA